MKLKEKHAYLVDNHLSEWISARQKANDLVSKQYPIFCICGRLCTGLHEQSCSRFKNRVNSVAIKSLEHLFSKKEKLEVK